MKIIRAKDYQDMSRKAANIISAQVIMKPDCVLGLATGGTPVGTYAQLVDWYNKGDLDFSEVTTVNLDEYRGLPKEHPQSYWYFMNENLFSKVNIDPAKTNLPDGTNLDTAAECARYNGIIHKLGGIDLQLLGIGPNGHIGFNEPGEAFELETHCIDLAPTTIEAGGIIMPANDEKYFKEVSIPNGVKVKSAKIHEALIEADAWINVPILKNHGGAKLSCAMKNYMGIVWDRRFFHQNDLQQCIADICTWQKKPVLNIVDAYRMMHQNGPQGKSAADVATLKSMIVSPNIIAIDTAALALFNQVKKLDMEAVSHISKGEELKLGTTDLKKVNIKRIKI